MPDTTIKKVESASSPRGEMGQKYLVGGKRVSMRLWVLEPGSKIEAATSREYETVGYVISGRAKLDLEGQTLNLKAGDAWLVPAGAMHEYTIIEPFTAVEATAPPSEVHGRDELSDWQDDCNTATRTGAPSQIPNFYKKPNGIFYVGDGEAGILETGKFLAQKPKANFTTQSGPMLVIDGAIHPAFIVNQPIASRATV
jgi:quercetin dioxygenase-like cupin family protein